MSYMQCFDSGEAISDTINLAKFKRFINTYCCVEGHLYQKSCAGSSFKCMGIVVAREAVTKIHKGDFGEHQGERKLFEELLCIDILLALYGKRCDGVRK